MNSFADAPVHPHRRFVRWIKTGVSRGLFPQKALYEIGSALTLFKVKKNVQVFEQFLEAGSENIPQEGPEGIEPETVDEWIETEPSAARLDQFTRDFILKTLLQDLSHEEFEHFTADLLRAMGYQARVTPYSSDGGVDVIAHRDPLGLEPPVIKVSASTQVPSSRDPTSSGSAVPWHMASLPYSSVWAASVKTQSGTSVNAKLCGSLPVRTSSN